MKDLIQQLISLGLDELGQDDLQRAADVSPEAIQAAQQGDLTSWDLAMMVRLAEVMGVDPKHALRGGRLPIPQLVALLREPSWGLAKQDTPRLRGALSRAGELRQAGLWPSLTYAPSRPPRTKPWENGYQAARRLRKDLGCPEQPLVDLRGQIESKLGVLVCAVQLTSPGVEAVAIADERGSAIVINTAEPRPASHLRRSIAHELCHLLFDQRAGAYLLDTVQVSDESEPESRDQREGRERRARAFAAELLVPKTALDRLAVAGQLVNDRAMELARRVCEEFGAPWELVVHHLHNHGFIDEGTAAKLRLERPYLSPKLGVGASAALRWAHTQVREGELSAGRARALLGAAWPDGDGLAR